MTDNFLGSIKDLNSYIFKTTMKREPRNDDNNITHKIKLSIYILIVNVSIRLNRYRSS